MIAKLLIFVAALFVPWPTCDIPKFKTHPAPVRQQLHDDQQPGVDDVGPARIEYQGAILICDEPVHDVGEVWMGLPVYHEFPIRNEGTNEGWFRVTYCCGSMSPCIVRVEPGETVYIQFQMRSDKLRGKFEKSATIGMIADPADACFKCRRGYDSESHVKYCKPVCFERTQNPICIRQPRNACEAAP